MKKYIIDLRVVSLQHFNDKYVLLKLSSDEKLPAMLPGQFVEVRVDGSPNTFLRRPISINLVDYDRNELWLLVAAVGEEDGEPAGEVVLHPFLRIGDLDGFLAEVLPSYAGVLGRAELGRLGPVALRRAMVRAVIWWPFVAAAVGIGMWLLGLSGLAERAAWLTGPLVVAAAVLSAVLLVGLVTDALLSWRFSRYGHTDRELVLVSGGLTRCIVMVSRAHVQHLAVSANPFQRRAGVASLAIRTAASRADGLALRDLPAGSADALLAWFRPRG